MSTTAPSDVVEAYIDAVRMRLADVPEEERVDLIDEVAAHVREIADEFGAEELEGRLGTAEAFTNELRASAGYATTAGVTSATALGGIRRMWVKATARLGTEANRALWRQLEPGWFVVRGVMLGYVALMLTGAEAQLVPSVGNNDLLGFAVLGGGAVASYRLGDLRPFAHSVWIQRARIAGEVALVLVVVSYLGDAGGTRVEYVDGGASFDGDRCLRDGSGQPIGNLYAFDPAGQLIPQFFLTDQAGRPINNLCPDQVTKDGVPVDTQYARDVNGAPVYGVFPRAQFQHQVMLPDGTASEPRALAPPAVVLPQLAPLNTPTSQAPAP